MAEEADESGQSNYSNESIKPFGVKDRADGQETGIKAREKGVNSWRLLRDERRPLAQSLEQVRG